MNDFIIGGISGMAGIIASHPIDTIKTIRQKSTPLNNRTISKSIPNLYRGVSWPFLCTGIEKAIVFWSFHRIYNITENTIISGGGAGMIASFFVGPYEGIKISRQLNIECSFKSLYRGIPITMCREVPGFAIYFTAYEFFQKKITNSFISGGLAGGIAWIFIYPQDVIKTRIQSDKQTNISREIKRIYRSTGIKGFYHNFTYALLRSMVLHATVFSINDYLKSQ